MLGVQSFVAQRQQGQLKLSRQELGSQHRIPVPTTKLENTKKKPSVEKSDSELAAPPPVAWSNPRFSAQKITGAAAVQDGFDTDVEGFEDTTTMSFGGSSRGHLNKGDGCDPASRRNSAYAAQDIVLGAQVSFRRGQEEPYHVQISRQLDAVGSEEVRSEEDDEGSLEDGADEGGNEESDDELVRIGILQELNSPGFSKYLQGKTSHTTRAIFQPIMATPVIHGSLTLTDGVEHSQQTANSSTYKADSVNGGAADPDVDLQRANHQVRATKKTSAVPSQKVQGAPLEQLLMSAQLADQHRTVSDHHQSSLHPSVKSHQTLRPILRSTAQDTMVANLRSQAHGETPLSVHKGRIDLDDDGSPVEYHPNVDSRHDRKIVASADGPQTQKRARDLDYSLDQIPSLTFHQLSNEPFNITSDTARTSIPQELSGSTLAAKINYILENLKDDDAKSVQRRAFFASLSIEQYEECASLMIRRFSDIVSKFTDTRQQRRRAAKDFEGEIAKREEYVRGKTTVVNRDLGTLKRGGEEVVRSATS